MYHRGLTWALRSCPVLLLLAAAARGDGPPLGFREEVRVSAPTRLDWKFAASAFGPGAARIPAGYDSRKQRYQLYVPRSYDRARSWPLVVFISPGDDPLGWRWWQKVCERNESLFCAAYGAGNSCPVGQRARIVLDVLDDIRRQYRIDPDRTYLTGFSGGGRMACTLAFALPEYFGGVAAICGINPLPGVDPLRHRIQDRLSIALVTGENDFNRKETEAFLAPVCQELAIRSKLWVVPKLGHEVPSPDVLAEVAAWLADDLERRQRDRKARPGLAAAEDSVPIPEQQAARQVETAEAELKTPGRLWRGAALLRGVIERWSNTTPADRARELLRQLESDPERARTLAEEGGQDERQTLAAHAAGFDRLGDLRRARQAWQLLARNHPSTAEGQKAEAEARRLAGVLAATPYLGVAFADGGLLVAAVVARGPADLAGLRAGDRLASFGGKKLAAPQELRQALAGHKPGDRVEIEVQRGGKAVTMTVTVGSLLAEE
jgi:hypothetical protein